MISLLDTVALLLGLGAIFGWANARYAGLPPAVGFLLAGLLVSLLLAGLDVLFPNDDVHKSVARAVLEVDFTGVVMNGMLAFLLFAGAFDVDWRQLRLRALPVAILALAATTISTALVGLSFWWVASALGQPLTLPWALVFGALISPTDPVAVLSTLKQVKVPEALEVEMQGESLFNDGVGVVLFTTILGFATRGEADTTHHSLLHTAALEVGGGIALGLVSGFVAYRAMKAIDDFPIEVLITLALVTGTYAVAQHLGMSGPLAVVAAGILVGDRGPRYAMSERTERYVTGFWTLVDEVLNAVLFLLIGLEVITLRAGAPAHVLVLAAIPIVLLSRLVSVSLPVLIYPINRMLSGRNIAFLTWGAVRGGISIALALSLPNNDAKPTILAATYAVVVFTILLQAPTLGWVARKTLGPTKTASD